MNAVESHHSGGSVGHKREGGPEGRVTLRPREKRGRKLRSFMAKPGPPGEWPSFHTWGAEGQLGSRAGDAPGLGTEHFAVGLTQASCHSLVVIKAIWL